MVERAVISILVFLDFNYCKKPSKWLSEQLFQSLFSWILTIANRSAAHGSGKSISILVFLDFNNQKSTEAEGKEIDFNPCFLGF